MKKNEKKTVATLHYLTALLFMVAGAISRNFVFVSLGCVYIALGSAASKKAGISSEDASKNMDNREDVKKKNRWASAQRFFLFVWKQSSVSSHYCAAFT